MTIPVTLAQLTTPATPQQALAASLVICQKLGLPTLAWQPLQMVPDIIETNATLAANLSQLIANIASGAYATTAAAMVDSQGNPITVWLDLRASDQYNVTRIAATYAAGVVPYVATSSYSYAPNNPLHFANAVTGATYTSTGSGTVNVGTGTVPITADAPGSQGTSAVSIVLVALTPLVGVTIQPLTASIVGSDLESNAALLARGQNKLGTIAPIVPGTLTPLPGPVPGDTSGVYRYIATSIPQSSVASSVPPFAVTSPITRVAVAPASGTGLVTVYVANANGQPSAFDVSIVQAAYNAYCVRDGVVVTTLAAANDVLNINATIYATASSPISVTGALNALAQYLARVPIGGITTTAPNIVPFSELIETIFNAAPGIVDVVISSPLVSPSVPSNGVPTLGISSTITIVYVP